jgi:uncharacterized protein
MESLYAYQSNLLNHIPHNWYRYLYPNLKFNERLLGIKGLRGVGKTTMLLQFMAQLDAREKTLYVTCEHPYFYNNSLFDLAEQWSAYGGNRLLIDEIHKHDHWSRQLKLIYDGFPALKVIFTSSSALDLYKGEADLSRRLVTQELHGLSFREFINIKNGLNLPAFNLEQILTNHEKLSREIVAQVKPLSLFHNYLESGYFPFVFDNEPETNNQRIFRILNTVLETDLAYIEGFSTSNVEKLKKLLGVIAVSAPFEPNISKIASRLEIGRNTLISYLKNLKDASVLNFVFRQNTGISYLQKPNKIYFENTAFAKALQADPNVGTLRETFFLNQLSNFGHQVQLSLQGDFHVDNILTFEIGGKNKGFDQIKDLENAYIAADDIEYGFDRKIPIWLFGFLY